LPAEYINFQKIARGASGEVYQAYQPSLKRYVAIKKLSPDLPLSSEKIEKFKEEALFISSLKHPNIVTLYDFCLVEKSWALVMEYLEGFSLDDYLRDRKIFPEIGVIILSQILAALSSLHQRKIIHQDLKPAHILIEKNGVVKLTDFGLAKFISTAREKEKEVKGTALYLSPEQISKKPLGVKTDIFSLGIIFYQVCQGGKHPFSAPTVAETLNKIANSNPQPCQNIHPTLERIINQMLEKNPQRRISTFELKKKLDEFCHRLGILDYFQEVKNWLAGGEKFQAEFKKRKIKFLLENIHRQIQQKDPHQALIDLEAVFQEEPHHPEAQSLLKKIENAEKKSFSPSFLKKDLVKRILFYLISSVIVVFLLTINNYQPTFFPEKTPQISRLTKTKKLPLTLPSTKEEKKAKNLNQTTKQVKKSLPKNLLKERKKDLLFEPEKRIPEKPPFSQEQQKPTQKIKTGTITIHSSPWSKVYINNKYYRIAPFSQPIILPAGKHHLKLTNENCEPYEEEIEVIAGQNKHFKIFLKLKKR
jgi:serine/threonine protein kinase